MTSSIFLILLVALDGTENWNKQEFQCSKVTTVWSRDCTDADKSVQPKCERAVGILIENDKYKTMHDSVDELIKTVRKLCGKKSKL